MKKLFVSVPMEGFNDKIIAANILKMKKIAEAYEGEELDLIESFIQEKPPEDCYWPVWYLGKSLEKLAEADIFIGIDDTSGYKGCEIEALVASRYGIKSYKVETSKLLY